MLKILLTLFAIVSVCYCQSNYNVSFHKRKPYYDPYYHLIYGGGLVYYLTFIIVKIKVVFILGSILTFFIFAGKFVALIKYFESGSKHDHKVEKIYVPAPSHDFGHGPPISYSPPTKSFSPHHGSSFPSGLTVDHLPPNAEIAGGHGGPYYDSPPPNAYGRGYTNDGSLYEYYDMLKKMLSKINLTELAFNSMKIKTDECKRKFVCSADYHAKYSSALSTALEFFRDANYDKYKTNSTISTLKDCIKLYPNCRDVSM